MRTLADLPIPTLVTSYENTIAAYERPGLTPQARESHNRFRTQLAEALEVKGFIVDPERAHFAAILERSVRRSREYWNGVDAADRAFNAPGGMRWQ